MNARQALAVLVATGALGLAAKALRHGDEGAALIGPTARAVVEEVRAPLPKDEAVSAATIIMDQQGDEGG